VVLEELVILQLPDPHVILELSVQALSVMP
jgi:hypothetical protein